MSFYDIPWEIFYHITNDFTLIEKIKLMDVCKTWQHIIGISIKKINIYVPNLNLKLFPNLITLKLFEKYDIRHLQLKKLDLSMCKQSVGILPNTIEYLVCNRHINGPRIRNLVNLKTLEMCSKVLITSDFVYTVNTLNIDKFIICNYRKQKIIYQFNCKIFKSKSIKIYKHNHCDILNENKMSYSGLCLYTKCKCSFDFHICDICKVCVCTCYCNFNYHVWNYKQTNYYNEHNGYYTISMSIFDYDDIITNEYYKFNIMARREKERAKKKIKRVKGNSKRKKKIKGTKKYLLSI